MSELSRKYGSQLGKKVKNLHPYMHHYRITELLQKKRKKGWYDMKRVVDTPNQDGAPDPVADMRKGKND
jgi:hypothetical protein